MSVYLSLDLLVYILSPCSFLLRAYDYIISGLEMGMYMSKQSVDGKTTSFIGSVPHLDLASNQNISFLLFFFLMNWMEMRETNLF